MANPLKILTDLQVSGALGTSGSLSVGGNGSLTVANGVTVTAGGLTVTAGGLTVTAGTSAVQGLTATTISGSSVTASALSVSNAATIGGNLTVTGDLTVNGTTTTVNTTNLLVEDAIIQLGSSSAGNAVADGDRGFVFSLSGSDSKAFFWDNSDSKFKLTTTTTAADQSSLVPGTAQALEVGALTATTVVASSTITGQSGLIVTGSTSLNGAVLFQTNTDLGSGTGSLLNLTGTLNGLNQYIGSLESQLNSLNALTANQYDGRRSVVYGTKTSGQDGIRVLLSGNLSVGSFSTAYVTGGSVQLSESSANNMIDQARNLSIDVAVRGDGWINDLTSVKISASQGAGGDSFWWPYIVIDAPAASTNTEIRLIVVNEKSLQS